MVDRPEAAFDVAAIRAQFPALRQQINGRPLVYLDSGASTQKPQAVIDAHARFYEHDYANIHRGVYELSQRATAAHDEARRKLTRFINAASWREVIFTRNATESINLVAQSFLRPRLQPGDEILVTEMEHHANIVPWQLIGAATGARLVAAPVTLEGILDLDAFAERINARTRLIAFPWISNVLGTINPVDRLIELAKDRGIPVLVDAAQAVQHLPVDVQGLGADFIAFSGHKMYGPSGVGVLWGKLEHLEAMPPYQGGGDMIEHVTFEATTWNEVPFKFEAGTPDIAGIVALGHAVDWIESVGIQAIARHEASLLATATRDLSQIEGLEIIGRAPDKASVLTFKLGDIHPQDVATMLDLEGIAIRTGHHCAMPLHAKFGLSGSARASLGVYNDESDIAALSLALRRVARTFAG
ncbi:cysteine desulfurase / selenocysteine lyase [Arboricoccus pini]|uniref:cysteine desulfurase n=1 Tax=Arboricoccus pini TaxID=1963835 RepID=A0A212QS83_9PROT|nr:cysteine desulfurase [Arboricoccus pini]SNB62374.1 cysteine desulfurase / selenocysteine lyase [Arboricoccus pini]